MPDFTVRAAVTEDSQALSRCITAAYSVYKDRNIDLPDVSIDIDLSIDTRTVWIAQIKDMIVGVIVLTTYPDHLLLENIAVHPDHGGKGIGKALIRLAESECAEQRLHEIRLSTHRDIAENINLYKHLGWHVIDDIGNKIHMSKTIETVRHAGDRLV